MNKRVTVLFILSCFFLTQHSFSQADESIQLKEYPDLLYVDASQVENDSLQRLNLVVPQGVEDLPLLMWIGGGAWAYVDRHIEMDLARKMAGEGMAVATVGHRLSPALWRDSSMSEGIQHPGHVEDIAAAFKWLYDQASTYGYNRDQIFIGGYSSGGHLAALLSLDEKYVSSVGLSRDVIRGVIPVAGAYDIVDYHRVFLEGSRPELAELHVQAVFGDTQDDLMEASPTSYVNEMSVPMLLISENQSFAYTSILENEIEATGFEHFNVIHVEEMGHSEFWNHLSQADSSLYRDAMVEFITGRL